MVQLTGRTPIRGYPYDTRFPTDKMFDWTGYLPYENNPWALDPGAHTSPLPFPFQTHP